MSDVNGSSTEELIRQRQAKGHDAWQAASLLVGLYGESAAEYANARRRRVQQNGDLVATRTWDLIVSEVKRLVKAAPE